MAYIWDRELKNVVTVKSMKNFKVPEHPDLEFFVHKAYKRVGYTVTERSTGAAVISGIDTRIDAEILAKSRLAHTSKKKMKEMICQAFKESGRIVE